MIGFLEARDEMIDARMDAENRRSNRRPIDTIIENGEACTAGKKNQYDIMRPPTMPEIPGQVDTIMPCLSIVLLM
jgi:hypothetical protein